MCVVYAESPAESCTTRAHIYTRSSTWHIYIYIYTVHSSSSRSTQKSPTQYFFSLLHAVISPRGSPKNWSRPPRWKFATFKRPLTRALGSVCRGVWRVAAAPARARVCHSSLPAANVYRVARAENRVTRLRKRRRFCGRCARSKGPGDFQSGDGGNAVETVTIRRKSVPGANGQRTRVVLNESFRVPCD